MQQGTLMYYEQKVAEQVEQLERMNAERREWEQEEEDEEMEEEQSGGNYATEEDLRAEEEAVRALDRKKRELQARLKAVEQDLGGPMEF